MERNVSKQDAIHIQKGSDHTKHRTIHVNIHELEKAVTYLKMIRDALDHEQHRVKELRHLCNIAIQGTAPNIKKFDHQFDIWLDRLAKVASEADILYHVLYKALRETHENDLTGVLKALASMPHQSL